MSLSGANRNLRKILGPLIRSYIIDAFELLFSRSELTPEFLTACHLRIEEPYISLRKTYSQFMPNLEMSKFFHKKLFSTGNYQLLLPIIRRTLERTSTIVEEEGYNLSQNEDENSLSVDSKLIIENSIRLIYVDYFDDSMRAIGPSFNEFCNFIDDIYGNGIYHELWLRNFRNYNIRSFELLNVPIILIHQNIAIFYYFIDKRIFIAGFYRRLIELQSPELLANRNFHSMRAKELEMESFFRLLNEFLSILAALSFHYFGIYEIFYLWLIFANFYVFILKELNKILPIQNVHNVIGAFVFPMDLLKNNSYLILVLMLLIHFKCYLFGTGVQSLSSEL